MDRKESAWIFCKELREKSDWGDNDPCSEIRVVFDDGREGVLINKGSREGISFEWG